MENNYEPPAPHPQAAASQRRMLWALLLLVAAGICFINLGLSDIIDISEGMRLQPALEMQRSGDWVVPRIDGKPYLNKPPLIYWIIIAAYKLEGGPSLAAGRLPIALGSLLLVLLTAWLGQRYLPGNAGPWAGLILAVNYFFRRKAQFGSIDPILALVVLMAVYCHWQALARRADSWLRETLAAGLLMGAAFLLKGPVLFPFLLAAVLGLWITLRPAWGRLLASVGVILILTTAISLPWCWLLIHRLGWSKIWAILHRESLTPIVRSEPTNSGPITFYLTGLAAAFLPWTPLLALWAKRDFRKYVRTSTAPFFRFSLWFALFSFIFFSLFKGKEMNYLLPIFPCLALACGLGLDWLLRPEQAGSRPWNCAHWTMAALAVGCVFLPILPFIPVTRFFQASRLAIVVLFAAAPVAAFCLVLIRKNQRLNAAMAFALMMALTIIGISDGLKIKTNEKKSPRLLAADVAAEEQHGMKVYRWKVDWAHYLWYVYASTEPLPTSATLHRMQAGGAPLTFDLLTTQKEAQRLMQKDPELTCSLQPKHKRDKYGIFDCTLRTITEDHEKSQGGPGNSKTTS